MQQARKITRVEVSGLFWKDLSKWRTHKDYWAIRAGIAEMVQAAARGEYAGDKQFTGNNRTWDGIRHKHVKAKLICFTMYPDDETMRICALKKHDFYGFRNERKSRAEDAARKVRGAADRPPEPSPEWPTMRWQDPGHIAGNPELKELSREGLEDLYRSVLDEQDSFDMLRRRIEADQLSAKMQESFAQSWMDAVIEAQAAIEAQIVVKARRRALHCAPKGFEDWGAGAL